MKRLFLLDGMALVYRAHFALMSRPIFTSAGVNTSALYGFTQTLLDILKNQKPTHLAVAFDTDAPTPRHAAFPEYKAQRQAMPEDLSKALPQVRRLLEAFQITTISCDGCEADDIIGTLVCQAAKSDFQSFMVTPDKDFGQLVGPNTFLYKPSRMGDGVEILGLPEVLQRWGIERPEQITDIMGLWGDTSDNIPGVPGIGEKTAIKLISQYGSLENLLSHTHELKGKLKESLETHRDLAILSKKLATIDVHAPIDLDLEKLALRPRDDDQVKSLFVEFEFNSIGRRLYGEEFKAGRGFRQDLLQEPPPLKLQRAETPPVESHAETQRRGETSEAALSSNGDGEAPATSSQEEPRAVTPNLKTLADVPHEYILVDRPDARRELVQKLERAPQFAFSVQGTHADANRARLSGLAFSLASHQGWFVPFPASLAEEKAVLLEFKAVLESEQSEKTGFDLKFDLKALQKHGVLVGGKIFDVMLAHSLIEPDHRHSLEYLAEAFLGYTPIPVGKLIEESCAGQLNLGAVDKKQLADYGIERTDLALQLREKLAPQLKEKGQERVFYEIEAPLLPALAAMELEGIRIDTHALTEFGRQLSKEMANCEQNIYQLAGREFNLNSPKQLGEILFNVLKLADKPKKTKTGQFSTNEQTLQQLAGAHPVAGCILDYRAASKLKSTYVDALPLTVSGETGRVHTTFNQAITSTGRLQSQDPNLQNIPIRTEKGREIRKAFVPRDNDYLLLSADYSQIELRIIAAISGDESMREDFQSGLDIHTATAAKVFGVAVEAVTSEMRRKSKMVNYGIAYGISAFGLAQRLSISRGEAGLIIDQYFAQYPGVARYMTDTVEFCRKHGYVETVTGRRRYLRDITSSNATTRNAAERNAINAPIQGTAADMIKIAMGQIQREFFKRKLQSRLLLQVHDELVFDLYKSEKEEVLALVEDKMRKAISLPVPIEVEMGMGDNWLEAH